MTVEDRYVSYGEVRNGVVIDHDDFGLVAALTENHKKAFFSNPVMAADSQPLLNLKLVDGVVAGRSMSYLTKVKIGDAVYPMLTGSSLDVPEPYRHLGLGADLMYHFVKETDEDYLLAAGISEMALPLYKVLRFKLLEFPRLMYLRNSRSLVESKGFHGSGLKLVTALVNIPLHLMKACLTFQSKRLRKKFSVRQETVVPQWVDEIVLNDGHKYMEVHDRAWLQWTLDHNLKGGPENIQSFYSVYLNGAPVGFFMTKERLKTKAGGKLKNILLGTVVEWGIARGCEGLDESMLYKMAFSTFSGKTDIIEVATDDEKVCRRMARWGFIRHGLANIAFLDKLKNCPDAKDIKQWRVRYGYSDTILS